MRFWTDFRPVPWSSPSSRGRRQGRRGDSRSPQALFPVHDLDRGHLPEDWQDRERDKPFRNLGLFQWEKNIDKGAKATTKVLDAP